jgi:Phage tail assembly chaperone proteins, E, or 41 or 14
MTTKTNEDGSTTITLSAPIAGPTGEPLTALTLRRPKAKDFRAMDNAKGEIGKSLALAGQLSGIPAPLLDNLDGSDFIELSEAVQGFLKPSQATGA